MPSLELTRKQEWLACGAASLAAIGVIAFLLWLTDIPLTPVTDGPLFVIVFLGGLCGLVAWGIALGLVRDRATVIPAEVRTVGDVVRCALPPPHAKPDANPGEKPGWVAWVASAILWTMGFKNRGVASSCANPDMKPGDWTREAVVERVKAIASKISGYPVEKIGEFTRFVDHLGMG